ncbi:hypothetical protein Tco_0849198, partial [Tanacetum coccineum]
MLVIKRFRERKKVFRGRKLSEKIRAKRMVMKEIEDVLLEEIERSLDGGLSKTLMVRMEMIMRISARSGLAKQGNASMRLCIGRSKIQKN